MFSGKSVLKQRYVSTKTLRLAQLTPTGNNQEAQEAQEVQEAQEAAGTGNNRRQGLIGGLVIAGL